MSEGRPLPNAIEAEKCVLCALINNADWALAKCAMHGVTRDSFYPEAHALIFDAVAKLRENRRPVDSVILAQAMSGDGTLERVGGMPELLSLATYTPTTGNIPAYLDAIADSHTKRQLYSACTAAASEAITSGDPAAKMLDALASTIARLSAGKSVADIETIKAAVMDKMKRMTDKEPQKNRLATGIDGLDQHSPLNLGDMPCISGERKAGKSMLALTILAHIGLVLNLPVAYVSLEDRTEQVVDRLTASVSRVPCWKHHAKFLTGTDDEKLNAACTKLGLSKIYVKDDIFDLSAIVAFIRRLKSKEPTLPAVVVDYAQLVRAREKGENREQEVAKISRTLRLLAMELRIAIILLCQLNTEGETRESKQIEMDTTAMWKVCNGKEAGTKLIAVPFQRNGASGIAFPLTFLGEICRFENQAKTELVDEMPDPPRKPARNFHKE